jgi:hypothetical protein
MIAPSNKIANRQCQDSRDWGAEMDTNPTLISDIWICHPLTVAKERQEKEEQKRQDCSFIFENVVWGGGGEAEIYDFKLVGMFVFLKKLVCFYIKLEGN